MPGPAFAEDVPSGSGRSGQTLVQPLGSSQGRFFWLPVSKYTVRPLPSTTTVPRLGTSAVLNIAPGDDEADAADVAVPPLVVDEVAFVLEEPPHAASATAATTPRAPTMTQRVRRVVSSDPFIGSLPKRRLWMSTRYTYYPVKAPDGSLILATSECLRAAMPGERHRAHNHSSVVSAGAAPRVPLGAGPRAGTGVVDVAARSVGIRRRPVDCACARAAPPGGPRGCPGAVRRHGAGHALQPAAPGREPH